MVDSNENYIFDPGVKGLRTQHCERLCYFYFEPGMKPNTVCLLKGACLLTHA